MLGHQLDKRASTAIPAPISVAPSQKFEGFDGPWSTFPIQIGTPPQSINILISTASTQTWAIDPQGCVQSDLSNCSTSRGGFFNSNKSSTWSQNVDASNGLFPIDLEANLNVTAVGAYGDDTVTLGGQGSDGPELQKQVVATIANKAFYLGSFGLNPQSVSLPQSPALLSSFLSNLNASNSIPSLSWSYTAGNQYRPGPVFGSLTLGGYDTSRFEPNGVTFPFNDSDVSRSLTVNIGAMFLHTNDFDTILENSNQSLLAAIDSTTPYVILPLELCQQFEEAFGLVWRPDVQAYLVNETLHSTLQTQNTSVTLTLGNSSTIPGEGFNISLPYGAFDLIAEAPRLTNSSRYFPLMRAADESQVTLGRTFLQEAYLIADYERKNFTVSQCKWDQGAQSHIVAIRRFGDDKPSTSQGLSSGAIAGIAIGAVVAAIIVAVLGVSMWRKHRRGPKDSKPKHIDVVVPELDSSGNDPYKLLGGDMSPGLPHSPELEGNEHKGHELEASPKPDQQDEGEPPPEPLYELDANTRRSQAMTSPISFMSDRSDATRLHQRQQSDPVSLSSAVSGPPEGPEGPEKKLSEPISPMRARSDAIRKLQREKSDAAPATE
ncbi:uncharacterized protein KY384_007853 [Bacidia gigantensis]|uniref:uncharacterized protein n=1 Tax=Bacidia gigantensis TaxID=2732470 RepID=UPI001D051570|nr:uncharacterized protein KY384_007853 [Bacidia gigantensis]KAG8527699.1 hypothetical protein KY384_007853 [Bacidia gigantensis]